MPTTTSRQFAAGVVDRFMQSKSVYGSVGASATDSGVNVGHPSFAYLPFGITDHCDLAVGYLDLSGFTARTFWDDDTETVLLARAVLDMFSFVVEERGGHVLGLRGDGLMVGWGDRDSTATVDMVCAVAACAFVLEACRGALNETLALRGIEPVLAKAGLDHGRCNFVRMGTQGASDINIIGFAANFAAKCEKYAHAWEIVVGQEAMQHLDPQRLTTHPDSPKQYQRNYLRTTYSFATFGWDDAAFLSEAAALPLDLAGRPSRAINTGV